MFGGWASRNDDLQPERANSLLSCATSVRIQHLSDLNRIVSSHLTSLPVLVYGVISKLICEALCAWHRRS